MNINGSELISPYPCLAERLIDQASMIQIIGVIDDRMQRYVLGALTLIEMRLMEKNPEMREPITCHITSPGGYVPNAIAISEAMRSSPATIITRAAGQCHSAAVLIVASGSTGQRCAFPGTSFLLHPMTFFAAGSLELIESEAQEARRRVEAYWRTLASLTKLSVNELKKLDHEHTYLTAQQALKAGIIDFIIPLKKAEAKAKPKSKPKPKLE